MTITAWTLRPEHRVTELCPQHAIFGSEGLSFQSCIHDICPSFSQKPQIKQKDKKTQSKQAPVWQGDAGTGRLGVGNSYNQHVRGANGKTGIHAEADGHCDPRVEILRENEKKNSAYQRHGQKSRMPYRSSKPDWAELKKGQGDWKSSNDKQQNQTVRGKMPRTYDTAKNENKNKRDNNRILGG